MSSKKVVSIPNFFELLTRYKEYNIVGHIRPDGDCVGSQLAIANILKQLGIKCNIIKNSDMVAFYHVFSTDIKLPTIMK